VYRTAAALIWHLHARGRPEQAMLVFLPGMQRSLECPLRAG
jgi:hypothetical protein